MAGKRGGVPGTLGEMLIPRQHRVISLNGNIQVQVPLPLNLFHTTSELVAYCTTLSTSGASRKYFEPPTKYSPRWYLNEGRTTIMMITPMTQFCEIVERCKEKSPGGTQFRIRKWQNLRALTYLQLPAFRSYRTAFQTTRICTTLD